MNHYLDTDLKRWATWLVKQADRSMGWSGRSSISNLGMPINKTMDTHNVWTQPNEYIEQLNESIQKLDEADKLLIFTYYVETVCSYRKVAQIMSVHHNTIKTRLNTALDKLSQQINVDNDCKIIHNPN